MDETNTSYYCHTCGITLGPCYHKRGLGKSAPLPDPKGTAATLYVLEAREEIERLRAELAAAKADTERLAAMLPLFQEARDAITVISLTQARLHGLDLSLADRMDDVGIPERWKAKRAAAIDAAMKA